MENLVLLKGNWFVSLAAASSVMGLMCMQFTDGHHSQTPSKYGSTCMTGCNRSQFCSHVYVQCTCIKYIRTQPREFEALSWFR